MDLDGQLARILDKQSYLPFGPGGLRELGRSLPHMPLLRVVGRLVVRRRPSLVIAGPAVQAGVSEAPAARSRFPGRLAGARGPAELDPAGDEVVTERADCRLVLEHRCGHEVRRARVPYSSHADLVPARGTARRGKELARHAADHPRGPGSRRCSRCRRLCG